MLVRPHLAIALAAVLLAGTGCQDEPEPIMAPPTTSSSTPTASPTSTPPEEPESAEEFLRRWNAASDEAQFTGETEEYLSLGPGCRPCRRFVKTVKEHYASGSRVEGEASRVTAIKELSLDPPTYEMTFVAAPSRIVDKNGAETGSFPGGKATYICTLASEGGKWRMVNFSQKPD